MLVVVARGLKQRRFARVAPVKSQARPRQAEDFAPAEVSTPVGPQAEVEKEEVLPPVIPWQSPAPPRVEEEPRSTPAPVEPTPLETPLEPANVSRPGRDALGDPSNAAAGKE